MRIMYSHDNPFIRHGGQIYSQGSFTSKTWGRFLPHVDEVVVVGRGREGLAEEVEGLNRADAERVRFEFSPKLPVFRGSKPWRAAWHNFELEVKRVDVVVVRMPSLFGLLAGEVARAHSKPLACEVVGCARDAYWNYGTLPGKLLAYPTMYRVKRLVQQAEMAVYVTTEFLQNRYPCPGRIESASNVELIEPAADIQHRRLERIRKDKADEEFFEIGLIGSYKHIYKGWDTSIRAIGRIAGRYPVRMRILGTGDPAVVQAYRNQQGVNAQVVCDGILPAGQPVLDWMDNLDCYIQPSMTEGLPRAVIEAMSRGLPCFGSTVGGIPELVGPDCLLKPHDDVRLAELLSRVIEDRGWALRLSQQNFEKAKSFYAARLERHRSEVWRSYFDTHRSAI